MRQVLRGIGWLAVLQLKGFAQFYSSVLRDVRKRAARPGSSSSTSRYDG